MKNIILSASAMAVLLLASCKKNDSTTPPVTPVVPRTDIHIDSSNATLGKYIVDKDGKTLYFFSNDVAGVSTCTGGCLAAWPIFYVDNSAATYSNGLVEDDFKTITTTAGTKQTTYKGWPLYYFAPGGVQEAAGKTTGEGVGNVWFVAKTNYSIMLANTQLIGANGTSYQSNYAAGTGNTNYFVDGKGNTLYAFGHDSSRINKFTKPDFSNDGAWPIYQTDNITVPSTLDKSLFVVTTFNGKKQLAYKGWPLYYFGSDGGVRGANKGITIPSSLPVGSTWPIVFKDVAAAP